MSENGLIYPADDTEGTGFPLELDKGDPDQERTFSSVDRLKAGLRDLARPNLFKVDFVGPAVLGPSPAYSLMCKAASFPGMEVSQLTIPRAGNRVHVPGDTTFEEFTVTFFNDVDFEVRSFFHRWQRMFVSNWVDGFTGIVQGSFGNTVKVSQFDSNFDVTYTVELFNAWPNRVGGINLSMDELDSREDFQVSFSYTYYEIYSGKQGT